MIIQSPSERKNYIYYRHKRWIHQEKILLDLKTRNIVDWHQSTVTTFGFKLKGVIFWEKLIGLGEQFRGHSDWFGGDFSTVPWTFRTWISYHRPIPLWARWQRECLFLIVETTEKFPSKRFLRYQIRIKGFFWFLTRKKRYRMIVFLAQQGFFGVQASDTTNKDSDKWLPVLKSHSFVENNIFRGGFFFSEKELHSSQHNLPSRRARSKPR